MSRRCPSERVQAFTLIELLVVISIIALLLSILLPSLSSARHQVRTVVCRSNMKQLMNGMFLYNADFDAFPGTHGLFWFQRLFGAEWPRPSGVTWDGARDRIVNISVTPPYEKPYHTDPEFVADVPGRGTLFKYLRDESVYTCPVDRPGPAEDSPIGGGGNGRLSYSLNAFVGYRPPESLGSFTYVAASLNNALPGDRGTRSFNVGQRVVFPTSRFMTLFEEHPNFNINGGFPDGNFNGLDRIATRHMATTASAGQTPTGRTGIAYLDGHAESPKYPAKTEGRQLFPEYGQPYFWRASGPPDTANVSAFVRKLSGPCPW